MEVTPGYKRTELGMIPDEWRVTSVGDAFEVCNNLRLPISQAVREQMLGDYPYYGPTNVQSWINEFRVEGEFALIGEDGDHFLKWRIQPMTLLVRGRFNVNNHAHLVRGIKNLTAWFYWYFVNRDITTSLTRQGASRYKLTKATLLQLPCVLPPLPEQRAITAALSDVDALLSGLERLITKKRDLKQAAMQQLLTGQTRLPGFSGEWEPGDLGSVVEALEAGVSVNSTDDDPSPGAPCVLKTSALSGGSFLPQEAKCIALQDRSRARTNPRRDSILISRMNTPDLVGEIAYVGCDYPSLYLPDRVWTTRFRTTADLDVRWLAYVLSSSPYRKLLKGIATGTSGSMKNISKDALLTLPIRFPRKDEQTAVAAILSDMDAEISTLVARRDKTRALKQAMMQELLTGKTRLVSPEVAHV